MKQEYTFRTAEDYVKAWEYLARIGVPFSYDVGSHIIWININDESFIEDPSIIKQLKHIRGEIAWTDTLS
jgi:hypothetical protein